MSERFSCAAHARALDEPPHATASHVHRWILVEQPGPWGRDAPHESQLPGTVAASLRTIAQYAGARLLLIRRHGRSAPVGRSCLVATTTTTTRFVERLWFTKAEELLTVDWSRLAAGDSVGGELLTEPVFLVCTNGKHDPCCAEYGRPLAKALSAAFGEQVWECSHIGGDRFAGNLVCLPDGLYFGRLDVTAGLRAARAYTRGRIDLPTFRGRSSLPFAAQAAEQLLRERTGDDALASLRHVDTVGAAGDRARVRFRRTDGRVVAVTVAIRPDASPRPLTCHAAVASHPPTYELLEVRELGEERTGPSTRSDDE